MARTFYGGSPADVLAQVSVDDGDYAPAAETLTVWDAATAGTQVTDLLDVELVPATTVTPDSYGRVSFYGPDGFTGPLWVQDSGGKRWRIDPSDLAARVQAAEATNATQTTDIANRQPLDSDLTAIAALSTTAYGRGILTLADQAALIALVEGVLAPLSGPVFTGSVVVPTADAANEAVNKGQLDAAMASVSTNETSITSTSPKTINNSAALAADSDFTYALFTEPNKWWLITGFFEFSQAVGGGTAIDVNMSLTLPAGCTGRWGPALNWDAAGAASAAKGNLVSLATSQAFATQDGETGIAFAAKILVGSTTGNFGINWAQNTAAAFDTIRLAGSTLICRRLT